MVTRIRLTQAYVAKLTPQQKSYDIYDDQIRWLFIRIEPTGKKNWHLRYGKRTVKIGPAEILNPGNARDRAQNFLNELYMTGVSPKDKNKSKYKTIGELLDEYDAAGNSTYLRDCIKGHFSLDMRIQDITLLWAEKWRNDFIKKGHKIATANRQILALKILLNWANNRDLTNVNLSKLNKLPETDSKTIIRYLNNEETNRLFEALQNKEIFFKTFVIVAYYTGIRRGAIVNLKWQDIDFDSHTLWLRADTAKNKKERLISINTTVINHLKKLPRLGEYVFTNPETNKRFYGFQKPWLKLLKEANIQDFRFHDLRHNFASMLLNKGVDLETIRRLLTHSDTKMSERYAHIANINMQKAVELLDKNDN